MDRSRGPSDRRDRALQGLLADSTRVLGVEAPTIRLAQFNLSATLAGDGHCGTAVALLEDLLQRQTRDLGADEPTTRRTAALLEKLTSGGARS